MLPNPNLNQSEGAVWGLISQQAPFKYIGFQDTYEQKDYLYTHIRKDKSLIYKTAMCSYSTVVILDLVYLLSIKGLRRKEEILTNFSKMGQVLFSDANIYSFPLLSSPFSFGTFFGFFRDLFLFCSFT